MSTVILLFTLFKRNFNNLLDPIAMHIFWLSGNIAFLTAYIYRYGISNMPIWFFLFFLTYIFVLKIFLKKVRTGIIDHNMSDKIKEKTFKIKFVYIVITFIYFFSKISFFKYAMENPSLSSWFFYRFVDLQGRDPVLRILSTGSEVYFYFFSFILIFLIKKWRHLAFIGVVMALLIGVFSGGRSSLLAALVYLGAFIFYFNNLFEKKTITKVNFIGVIMVSFAILVAIVVSTFYEEDMSIVDGFSIIVNRFIAVGDGLEYYMLYNGSTHIKSGLTEYFMAIFGVYVKQFSSIEYKNVGTQLTELVVGDVYFAQGANFVFPLQTMVLGFYSWFIYIPILAAFVALCRSNRTKSFILLPFSFFLSFHCFTFATDMEYALLCLISGVLIYLIVVYPILKIKF
ncbi:O-antigen polymerase [Sphingobacterium nematocida]|uniref:O-antigen polymerase n=1 Tax=Sphingobacterium nematocida TaxID=1513896 RepID=UPI00158FE9EF|nr:O-antigen polymerase [Sphingobacterium nematocida]